MTFDPAANAATVNDPPAQAKKGSRGGSKQQGPANAPAAKQAAPAANEAGSDSPPSDAENVDAKPPETPAEEVKPPANPSELTPPANEPPTPVVPTALVEIPIHSHFGDGKYASDRIDIRLPNRLAAALSFCWASAAEDGIRVKSLPAPHPDGKTIENGGNWVLHILEQVADQIEEQTGKNLVTDFGFVFR